MIDLNDMRLFAKVAELKGISPAARALDIPKSRVSRRITALESSMGVRLLERTTRAVQLTEMGDIFFQHCKRIVEESETALESVHQLMEIPRGLLRVSVSFAVGQYLIAPHLGDFLKLYPEIQVQMDLNNRRVDLITEAYDLVVRVGDLEDSSLMSRKIGHARAHLCASPDYIKAHGQPSSPNQLSAHKKLVMSNSNNTTQWLLENTAGILKSVDVEPIGSMNDFTALRTLIENDAGIAIMPEYVSRDAIANKRLVRVLPDWRSTLVSYYILYPSRKGLTKKSEAFIEFFKRKFEAEAKA
ncbi:MAG: LysR family transcriptional regulator [Sneathiella sp.]|nr:LysR family transcriptional regulator [Sneathiella sp.]